MNYRTMRRKNTLHANENSAPNKCATPFATATIASASPSAPLSTWSCTLSGAR
ncbi:hypothetical protein L226DRAFT_541229 [Lentinus tigrinus ALCF2SS1-7]|uniref:uncharacterized protein n=1 Tax=Lentinus tigrinus ALCF2SS1-7 TaxID=1328758 RepID=UPI0011661AAB|nr:hypothetical protein L226DRAFT_541229 [Lentinus tigrinus ALCF2SS1-7]